MSHTTADSSERSDSDPVADRETRLAEVFARLCDSTPFDAQPEWRQIAVEHPDLVEELQSLWGVAHLADDLGSGVLEPPATSEFQNRSTELAGELAQGPLATRRHFGEYEILEEIGRGGMGVVYRARQRSLGRIVALKVLLRGTHASQLDIARFRAESGAAALLDHPHITPVYDVGEHEGQPYFSMKFVAGTTLSRRLAEGPLPPREAARILAPVCRAIEIAHARGILHRDLKPSNILIDREGHPLVTDFGLAKRTTDESDSDSPVPVSLTQSGAILGTPSYMAPEQAAGRRGQVDETTDVYSLGAILYQMLTGRPPFQAANPVDTVLLVLEQDPLPPRLLNPQADPDLELIALKCLQKPQELRYATANDLARDLEAFLANEPISARMTNLSGILSRMLRETHHAAVLEHWGLLWMWHSLVLLVLCLLTNWFHLQGVTKPGPYLGLWTLGLGTWAGIFWRLRRRSGPITFVERQIAHVWAGSVICSTLLFVVEMILGLPVLTLSPVLGLCSGMVFMVKAGILSGSFYLQAAALFGCSLLMALFPKYGLTWFGFITALCFFLPGWKYYHQQQRAGTAPIR